MAHPAADRAGWRQWGDWLQIRHSLLEHRPLGQLQRLRQPGRRALPRPPLSGAGPLVVPFSPAVVALRLSQHAEAVLAARDPVEVAEEREHLHCAGVAPVGLAELGPDLIDGAELVHPVGPADRPGREHFERGLDQLGLAAKVTPGVELRADGVRDLAGLLGVAREEQVMPGFQQVVQVRPAILGPRRGAPLPVLGRPPVRGDQHRHPAGRTELLMQLARDPRVDLPAVGRAGLSAGQGVEQPAGRARREQFVQVPRRLIGGRRPAPVGGPRRSPVVLAEMEDDSVRVGRLAVDGGPDEQLLCARAQARDAGHRGCCAGMVSGGQQVRSALVTTLADR